MDDFNTNLMNYEHHHPTGQFLDGMHFNIFFSFDYTSLTYNLSHRYVNR